MKKKNVAIAGLLVLAASVQSAVSWAETGFGPGQSMVPADALKEVRASKAPAVPEVIAAAEPVQGIEWVTIRGGKFKMGSDDPNKYFDNARPVHEVSLKTFALSKTLVTVEQYAQCVSQGACTKPSDTDRYCNWGKAGRRRHPINCVDWDQANQYAKFADALLPSESEYEYAAKSGGKNQKYPWGDEKPTCERTVMLGEGGEGCGSGGTMPVCSKPAGNTTQGLCDMAGNVSQWMQDGWQISYLNAPQDGSAWETKGYVPARVVRGAFFANSLAVTFRTDFRGAGPTGYGYCSTGIRLARSNR